MFLYMYIPSEFADAYNCNVIFIYMLSYIYTYIVIYIYIYTYIIYYIYVYTYMYMLYM